MITRCCPACSKRNAQLISASCPICEGYGVVTLGQAALSMHEPATVSTAVEIAVEAVARQIDTTLTLSDDRHDPLRSAIGMLTTAGIVGQPGTRKSGHRTRHLRLVVDNTTAVEAAREYVPTVTPIDAVLTLAPAYEYAEHERPNARGLPILSAAGHPSHTARIADPMTPGNDTAETFRERRAQRRDAAVLVEAAPVVVSLKARKEAKQAARAARQTGIAA